MAGLDNKNRQVGNVSTPLVDDLIYLQGCELLQCFDFVYFDFTEQSQLFSDKTS